MKKAILVFGEDDNDRRSIVELIRALRPDLSNISVEPRRNPVVHLKQADLPRTRRRVVDDIIQLVKAQEKTRPVVAVLAHQDCDAVEPAHVALGDQIEQELTAANVPYPIAVTPAWEMEAWWMLFPDAVAEVRRCWNKLDRRPRHVGLVQNAKEVLRRALRPQQNSGRCPDYVESDSVTIATKVRELGLANGPTPATSDSYQRFKDRLIALKP